MTSRATIRPTMTPKRAAGFESLRAPFPMLAHKHAPSPETVGKFMALVMRLKRLARGDKTGVAT